MRFTHGNSCGFRIASVAVANQYEEQSFGARVRAVRTELHLSQEQLAARCISSDGEARSASWVSRIESDGLDPTIYDLRVISDALGVAVGWLVNGAASGDSEFIARMKGLELQLDRRGRNAVLAIAQQQVEDSE